MKNGKNEKLHLFRQMEETLNYMNQASETALSDECLRVIKRIFRMLRVLILENELQKVERLRQRGKLTGKQAQHLKAKVRKAWL